MSQVPNDVLLGSTGSTHPVQQIHDIFRFIPWAVQPEESLQVAVLFAQRSGPRPKTRAQTRAAPWHRYCHSQRSRRLVQCMVSASNGYKLYKEMGPWVRWLTWPIQLSIYINQKCFIFGYDFTQDYAISWGLPSQEMWIVRFNRGATTKM